MDPSGRSRLPWQWCMASVICTQQRLTNLPTTSALDSSSSVLSKSKVSPGLLQARQVEMLRRVLLFGQSQLGGLAGAITGKCARVGSLQALAKDGQGRRSTTVQHRSEIARRTRRSAEADGKDRDAHEKCRHAPRLTSLHGDHLLPVGCWFDGRQPTTTA